MAVPVLEKPDRPADFFYRLVFQDHPARVGQMTRAIEQREDYGLCRAFCDRLSFRESDEVLMVMSLLEQGAVPGLLAPASLGRLPHRLTAPFQRRDASHRPFPCLSFPQEFYFFGAVLQAPGYRRVPILKWQGGWSGLCLRPLSSEPEVSASAPLQMLTVEEILARGVPRSVQSQQSA